MPVVFRESADQDSSLDTVVSVRSWPPCRFRLQSTAHMPEPQPPVTNLVETLTRVLFDPRPRLHPTACLERLTQPAALGRRTLTRDQADLMRLYDQADPDEPNLGANLQALNDALAAAGCLTPEGNLTLAASRFLFDGWRIVDEPAEMVYESEQPDQQRTWRWR